MKTNALSFEPACVEQVLSVLNRMRAPFSFLEEEIHHQIEKCLEASGIAYIHEAKIGKGCRADFLVGTVVIEIKKGRPSPGGVLRQVERYAACPGVEAIILVSQAGIPLPSRVGGKPLYSLGLWSLWGVALP